MLFRYNLRILNKILINILNKYLKKKATWGEFVIFLDHFENNLGENEVDHMSKYKTLISNFVYVVVDYIVKTFEVLQTF